MTNQSRTSVGIAASLLWWSLPRGHMRSPVLALCLVHAFGISLVGLVNGSPSNVEAGLGVFHFGGALMAIVGGNVLVILAGTKSFRSEPTSSIVLGLLGLASLIMLLVSTASGAIIGFDYGVWERIAVYTIVAWQLLIAGMAFMKMRTPRTSAPPDIAL